MKDGIYSGLDAEFYDELLDGELEDIPFWHSLLETYSGRALEVGCGTGRVLLPLLKEGFVIDGIDSASRMVELLKEKAGEANLNTDVRVQYMESLDMGKIYSLIFIPGFSLQMVENRELLVESLRRFHDHLEPGGKLALSVFFPWEEMDHDESDDWHLRKKIKRPDGSQLQCHQSTQIDMEGQTLLVKNRYALLDKDRVKRHEEFRNIQLLWFYPHEFHLLLEQSGFELLETYSDFKYEPMDEFTPHAVYLAKKTDS